VTNKKTSICFIDLDGTLINTKSKKKFPVNKDDWELNLKTLSYVKSLKNKGYKLIVVTNQAGIESGIVKEKDFKLKLKNIQAYIGFSFDDIVIAKKKTSLYRKPLSNLLVKRLSLKFGWDIDKTTSVMIGDAGNKPSDWSDSDFKFAENLGIKFIHSIDL